MTDLSRRQIFAVTAGAAAATLPLPAAPVVRTVIDNQTGRVISRARPLDSWNAAALGFMTRAEIRALEDLPPLQET